MQTSLRTAVAKPADDLHHVLQALVGCDSAHADKALLPLLPGNVREGTGGRGIEGGSGNGVEPPEDSPGPVGVHQSPVAPQALRPPSRNQPAKCLARDPHPVERGAIPRRVDVRPRVPGPGKVQVLDASATQIRLALGKDHQVVGAGQPLSQAQQHSIVKLGPEVFHAHLTHLGNHGIETVTVAERLSLDKPSGHRRATRQTTRSKVREVCNGGLSLSRLGMRHQPNTDGPAVDRRQPESGAPRMRWLRGQVYGPPMAKRAVC